MSKKEADLPRSATRSTPFTTTRRGAASTRRAAQSSRLAREARQTRLAYLALFGVISLIVVILAGGAVWEYIIAPAQPVATVNGTAIRTDTFNRYQKFESFLLNNQLTAIQNQIAQLQADTKPKDKALNQALVSQYTQQQQQIQSNASNVPAYTLQQMETALEETQAAAKMGLAPTPAQLDAQMATLQKQAGGTSGYNSLLSNTGVQVDDLRTYFAAPAVVQTNVTNHFAKGIPTTQPEAKARHILVGTKKLALQLQRAIQEGAAFAPLAKKYSMDNGLTPGQKLGGKAKLAAEKQSSAFNGGWLRDPSQPFVANQPTWITSQTQYVKPVLDAILSMKPGQVRVVQSQFGFHVIQVTARQMQHLSKADVQQQAATKFQTWQQNATSATGNKVVPSDPYTQFPATSSTTSGQ